jgi:hypothetical protein
MSARTEVVKASVSRLVDSDAVLRGQCLRNKLDFVKTSHVHCSRHSLPKDTTRLPIPLAHRLPSAHPAHPAVLAVRKDC